MKHLPTSPWSDTIENTLDTLHSSQDTGLTAKVAEQRLQEYGQNIFETAKIKSPFTIFLNQFVSPLIIILCVAAVLTATLQEWIDTVVIAFAVIVNAIMGFIQEYKAEQAISDLRSYITHRTRIIRDGEEMEVDPKYIVPGDILHLTSGARITADARIIKEINFTVDESILTGESLPIEKTVETLSETTQLADRTNLVHAGTVCINGSAYALVTATGFDTEIGKLARLVDETESEQTPLQQAMSKLTWVIILVTIVLVVGVFIIGILNNIPIYEMLLLSIAVLVGSVPEALPIGLTAILAVGVERIAKRKGIIRNLTASETLGSTSIIITDKTGTLTQADMQLKDIDTYEQLIDEHFTPADHSEDFNQVQKEFLTLARCACDVIVENPEDESSQWVIRGDDLEGNIVRAAAKYDIIQSPADRSDIQIRIPFNSINKFSVTRIPKKYLPDHLNQFEDPHVVLGAPEVLIARSHVSAEEKEQLTEAVNAHSRYGRRVLGVGLLTPHIDPQSITTEHVKNITFLGALSFFDPIRAEVPGALERINSYGTRVVMATGDLAGTALAVANDLGWPVTSGNVLTGEQLSQLSDEELNALLDKIHIYARVSPQDKLRITRLFQARGEIVAMTGDGVNDSPSLKAANIGIAVGSGTDVAKGVADLILMDNNFQTIVAAIEEGRQILSNIKKLFVYLMSNALDELILVGGAIIAGVTLPLTAVQIIWVNLFTGSLPAIAFAFDRQQMRETNATSRTMFDKRVLFLTTAIGIVISLILFGLYLFLLHVGISVELARTILFACFGSYTLFISFSFLDLSRPIYQYSLTQNKLLLVGIGVGMTLLLITIYLPFFQSMFETTHLPFIWVVFVAFWIALNILIIEGFKWFANTFLVSYQNTDSLN
jgi:Ca2+-transporting ATPase